jgi:hypothetical protein
MSSLPVTTTLDRYGDLLHGSLSEAATLVDAYIDRTGARDQEPCKWILVRSLETVSGLWVRRGFKSLPLRSVEPKTFTSGRFGSTATAKLVSHSSAQDRPTPVVRGAGLARNWRASRKGRSRRELGLSCDHLLVERAPATVPRALVAW